MFCITLTDILTFSNTRRLSPISSIFSLIHRDNWRGWIVIGRSIPLPSTDFESCAPNRISPKRNTWGKKRFLPPPPIFFISIVLSKWTPIALRFTTSHFTLFHSLLDTTSFTGRGFFSPQDKLPQAEWPPRVNKLTQRLMEETRSLLVVTNPRVPVSFSFDRWKLVQIGGKLKILTFHFSQDILFLFFFPTARIKLLRKFKPN